MIESRSRMIRDVWPKLRDLFGGGELVAVECDEHNCLIASTLDLQSGADYFHRLPDGTTHHIIAARIQWSGSFPTFTIRYAISWRLENGDPRAYETTEWAKRKRARAKQGIRPNFFVQAYYVDGGKQLASIGVVEADPFVDAIAEQERTKGLRNGGGPELDFCYVDVPRDGDPNPFIVIPYNFLRAANVRFYVWRKDALAKSGRSGWYLQDSNKTLVSGVWLDVSGLPTQATTDQWIDRYF